MLKMSKAVAKIKSAYVKTTNNVYFTVVKNSRGDGAVDAAVGLIITVVLSVLILGFLYLLLNGTIFPKESTNISNMMNYSG